MFQQLFQLVYPNVCSSCADILSYSEKVLCESCYYRLGLCSYGSHQTHPIEKSLWGRGEIEAATSLFVFSKHSVGQRLLHQLKYKHDQEVGLFLGKLLGRKLLQWDRFNQVDALVPVPITGKKMHFRGYNQSEVICRGIQLEWPLPIVTNYLVRDHNTDSQTKKGRLDRSANNEGAFVINTKATCRFNNLLLIDDVLTTGATIESCLAPLQPNHKVCVATLAYQ